MQHSGIRHRRQGGYVRAVARDRVDPLVLVALNVASAANDHLGQARRVVVVLQWRCGGVQGREVRPTAHVRLTP